MSLEDAHQLIGQRAAVGVAQDEVSGAGLAGRAQRPQGVLAVRLIAVEVVLRVVDHLAAALAHERHRLRDHVQVLVEGGAQDLGDVEVARTCRRW